MLDYEEALQIERDLPPGPYQINCQLQAPLSRSELAGLREKMEDSGVLLTSLTQKGSVLIVKAVKPGPVGEGISFIPVFVAAIAILGGLAITFYSIMTLPRIIDALIPVTCICIVGWVLATTAPVIAARRK